MNVECTATTVYSQKKWWDTFFNLWMRKNEPFIVTVNIAFLGRFIYLFCVMVFIGAGKKRKSHVIGDQLKALEVFF